MSDEPKKPEPVDVPHLLLKTPLYKRVYVGDAHADAIRDILTYEQKVDAYCPGCAKEATFVGLVSESTEKSLQQDRLAGFVEPVRGGGGAVRHYPWARYTFDKLLSCTRNNHLLKFFFLHDKDAIVKVGQYPSLADLSKPEHRRYAKLLGPERLAELDRGVGLAAHGAGIGSFAYLRRIFESLIEDAHREAQVTPGWDEAQYGQSRVAEKVVMLKAYLPEFLARNVRLYKVLSLGLHELTEEICLKHFDLLKQCVLIILEEKQEKIDREKVIHDAEAALKRVEGDQS